MIGRWGLYGDLMRELRAAGFTPDEADRAARVAEKAMKARRDEGIRIAHRSGVRIRQLAVLWGVSKTHIHRLVSPDAGGDGTAAEPTLPSRQAGECRGT